MATITAPASDGTWVDRAGRIGLGARGVVYCLLGILAIALASGGRSGNEEVDQRGAMSELAERPLTRALLVAVAVGLVAYAAWRAMRMVRGEGNDPPDAGSRISDGAKVVIYGALAWSAVQLVRQGPAAEGSEEPGQGFTARLMTEQSWGRWAVGLAGAAVVVYGLWHCWRGVTRKFREHLEQMTSDEHTAVVTLGVVGHVARGVVFAVAGLLVVRAAVRFDPNQPIGIDAALKEVVGFSYGPILLAVIAFGLFAFGLYSMAEARFREVS